MSGFKYIKFLVLLLFAATSVMPGVVPLLNFHGAPTAVHHCDQNSCSLMCKGNCTCSVNHRNPDHESQHHRICGCSQGSDMSTVFSGNVQVKAVIAKSGDLMLHPQNNVYVFLKERETEFFVKEIFHPPRLSA